MPAKKKNPAAVALGRKGGKKGGPARAAKLTAAERSDSARKAVQARWARGRTGVSHTGKGADVDVKKLGEVQKKERSEGGPMIDTSKKALHLCLKRIKEAKDEGELRRMTEELQRIVFHRQYQNGED
jgi:hypothetical protein